MIKSLFNIYFKVSVLSICVSCICTIVGIWLGKEFLPFVNLMENYLILNTSLT